MHTCTIIIKNKEITERGVIYQLHYLFSLFCQYKHVHFLKPGYIHLCRPCFLTEGMQSRYLSIYVKIDTYFNWKGSFSPIKVMRFYFKVQMQANATLHMFKSNPSLDVYIGTKLFSSSEDKMCLKIVKDILYMYLKNYFQSSKVANKVEILKVFQLCWVCFNFIE